MAGIKKVAYSVGQGRVRMDSGLDDPFLDNIAACEVGQ